MSEFWKYFKDVLRWPQIHEPGALQVPAKGLALTLDTVRDDIVYLRDQFLPKHCDDVLVAEHGKSRSLTRYYKESPEQFRSRVINAYAWHMLGGKTLGLPEILEFYGFDIKAIEKTLQWAEFQINLPTPTNFEQHAALYDALEFFVWLVNEYKPARSILSRMYNDEYNITPLIYSEGCYSEHLYSAFSGVPATNLGDGWESHDDLQLSFGSRKGIEIESPKYDFSGLFSGIESHGLECQYLPYPVWSQFYYSDAFPERHGFTTGEIISLDWCEKIISSELWKDEVWDDEPWTKFSKWDRQLPEWGMRNITLSKSQLVYGHGCYSSLNSCYGVPVEVRVHKPLIWGISSYSDDIGYEEFLLHELMVEQIGIGMEARPQAPIEMATGVQYGFEMPYLDAPVWSYFAYSDPVIVRHGASVSEHISIDFCEKIISSEPWQDEVWDDEPWAKFVKWDRQLPEWNMQQVTLSKSQLVYGHGCYSSLNSCYGVPVEVRVHKPLIWGISSYSDDVGYDEIPLHELIVEQIDVGMEARMQEPIGVGVQELTGIAIPPLHDETWDDEVWGEGTWYDYRVYGSTKSIS